ncbi:uncharacterized protein [Watersipora subatra]|uniref:uncharacterized protein n=1 Tax=Watersipora subatra TaxID=2589382 RepID=UPI00355C726E
MIFKRARIIQNYFFSGTQRHSRGGGAGAYVRCGMAVETVDITMRGADVHAFRLVDHILTNTMENNIFSGTIKCDLSDHLPTFYITKCTLESCILSRIRNKSITTQIIPDGMKIARINPLYKKGNINKCENYRPISVLPIFSKITEKLINF